ncbi:MAG: FtsX-like permease family protein [Bacteroidota bacterium]
MSNPVPSEFFVRIFLWFCPDHLQESILGDLEEQFTEDAAEIGKRKAQFRFAWNVVRFIRPGILLRRKLKTQYNNIAMYKNYFKIAYRNLVRHKFFSIINVAGLSLGLVMSLFIVTHILKELSYEKSFKNYDQIYRLSGDDWARIAPPYAREFRQFVPETKAVGWLFSFGSSIISLNQEQYFAEKPFMADPEILKVFNFNFLEGDATDALDAPGSIVLTNSLAKRLFKDGEERIGQTVSSFGDRKYEVTGIIEDLPKNSHIKLDFIISGANSFISESTSRSWSATSVYCLFENDQQVANAKAKLLDFQVSFLDGAATREEIISENLLLKLEPITDIHLHSHKEKELEANSDMSFIYIFGTLGVFILLIVIINFINLYVAQTLNRLKEIGIRKVMGAYRKHLIGQFLCEAFFLVLIAAAIAMLIAYVMLPFYNNLAGITLTVAELFSPQLISILLLLVLVVGSIAGGYPAIYLSGFGINEGLKTKLFKVSHKLPLRTVMVAFQFFISVALLTATLIVSSQMNFIQDKELGFAREEVLAIKLHGEIFNEATSNIDNVRHELTSHADVEQVSLVSELVGNRFGVERFALQQAPENTFSFRYVFTDNWFAETMGLDYIDGDSGNKNATEISYVLNETAAASLQSDQLIGQQAFNSFAETSGKVKGIVKDFNFTSLHNPVEPLVIQISHDPQYFGYLLIRMKTDNLKNTLTKIEETINEFAPNDVIISYFIDDKMDQLYRSESNMLSVFKIFSGTIICLASLGLFALFAFISQARTKELGIRKTLGANLGQLLMLMSKSYLVILLITIIAAIPLTWYLADDWLSNFAFRISMEWWHFTLPGIGVLTMAAIAILSQSWKVANNNPIDSLQDE